MLTIKNLNVEIAGKTVLQDIDLEVKHGEVHALMGPNGAGKTSLAMALAGHPNYKLIIYNSEFRINGKDMRKFKPEERARKGLFVAFQQPIEVAGVSVLSFLRTAYKALYPEENIPLSEFKKKVGQTLVQVGLKENFMERSLNDGFSGGEKKRMEVVQLLMLKPKFAILDEIDSGLDLDSLKIVAQAIKTMVTKTNLGVILITHYPRIFHFLKPDFVHVLIKGEIKASDGINLIGRIEKNGYSSV